MKVIVFDLVGQTAICNPAMKEMQEGETEAQFLARVQVAAVPAGATNVRIMEQADALLLLPLPAVTDLADINQLPKFAKALGLLIAQYTGKTPAQVRGDFMTIFRGL